jgi:hypothetical protein
VKFVVGVIGSVLAALGAMVVIGMVFSLHRDVGFGVGTVSVGATLFEEACGLLALGAIAVAFRRLWLAWKRRAGLVTSGLAVVVAVALSALSVFVFVGTHSS